MPYVGKVNAVNNRNLRRMLSTDDSRKSTVLNDFITTSADVRAVTDTDLKAQNKGQAPFQAKGFNSQYMESWINEKLRQAQVMKDPSIVHLLEDNQKPLTRYDIDKNSMIKLGLSVQQIDNIYRALYVNTNGFFQMLSDQTKNIVDVQSRNIEAIRKVAEITDNSTTKNSNIDGKKQYILSNIWRVYQILLEYVCRTEYKMITQQLEK